MPKEPPPGVMPIFFTGQTQSIFHCVCDQDVTKENPFKLIPIQSILDDFKARAAVSDLHPCKAEMQAYTGTDVLVVFDPDFEYGENFYICLTDEARAQMMEAKVEEAKAEEQAAKTEVEEEILQVKAKREAGVWKSLGSEAEIADEAVLETRPLIKMLVSRRRRLFGAPIKFGDNVAKDDDSIDIKSLLAAENELHRLERSTGVQANASLVDTSVQTHWAQPFNASVQTAPRFHAGSVDVLEQSRIKTFLDTVYDDISKTLSLNAQLDMFKDDYLALKPLTRELLLVDKSENKMKEYQSFKYMQFQQSMVVTAVEWHPKKRGVLGVAYARKSSFDERVDSSSKVQKSFVIIWNFSNSLQPQMMLEALDDVHSFRFNPTNPNIVVGGCVNGQIIVWDTTEATSKIDAELGKLSASAGGSNMSTEDKKLATIKAVAVSNIESGHKCAITGIHWFPCFYEVAKNGHAQPSNLAINSQLVTIASDGTSMFWDIRVPGAEKLDLSQLDLTWKPFFKIFLARVEHSGEYDGTRISIATPPNWFTRKQLARSEDMISSKVFIGTEQGEVLYLDWKPPESEGKSGVQKIELHAQTHAGPVLAVVRSPFFPNIVLTAGGNSICIWKEGVSTPLLYATVYGARISAGYWSQCRPAVFYIGKDDGTIDAWDILDSSSAAVMSQNATSPESVTFLEACETSAENFLACGDTSGVLRVIELPVSLTRLVSNEEAIVEAWIAKEVQRITYVNDRQKYRAAPPKKQDKDAAATIVVKKEETHEEKLAKLKSLHTQFGSVEAKFLEELGLSVK